MGRAQKLFAQTAGNVVYYVAREVRSSDGHRPARFRYKRRSRSMKLLGKLVMLLLAAGAVIFGLALLRESRPDYIPVYDTDEDDPF